MPASDASRRVPTVTVGLPVYNGEPYLRAALDSVLAQTFGDWELVASDNGSTDGTAAILAEYAARDPRIRVETQPENRGAYWNFARVRDLCRTPYLTLLAADDFLADPDYLERTLAYLEAHPDTMVCASDQLIVDEDEKGEKVYALDRIRPDLPWPVARRTYFRFRWSPEIYAIYGVYRTEVLRRVWFPPPDPDPVIFLNNDKLMLARVAGLGRIVALPGLRRGTRKHRAATSSRLIDSLGPDAREKLWIGWNLRRRLLRFAWTCPIPWTERLPLVALTLRDLVVWEPWMYRAAVRHRLRPAPRAAADAADGRSWN